MYGRERIAIPSSTFIRTRALTITRDTKFINPEGRTTRLGEGDSIEGGIRVTNDETGNREDHTTVNGRRDHGGTVTGFCQIGKEKRP